MTPPDIARLARHGFVSSALSILLLITPPASAQFTGDACLGAAPRTLSTGGTNGAVAIQAGDLDQDEAVDLVTASAGDDRVLWFQNLGDGAPTPEERFVERTVTDTADGASAVFLHDLDRGYVAGADTPTSGSACLDVVVASANDDTIAWYEHDCDNLGEFTKRVITTNADGAIALHVADVNRDGCLDVLAASFNDNTVALYEQGCEVPRGEKRMPSALGGKESGPSTPLGTFTERLVTTSALGAASVWAADLEPGGPLEILAASRLDNTVAWFRYVPAAEPEEGEEETGPTFTRFVITNNAVRVNGVTAGDLDDDGGVDVASVSINDNKVAWYRNDGGSPPSFSSQLVTTSAGGPRSIEIAFVDDDDDDLPDLVVASNGSGRVRWYRNLGGSPLTFEPREVAPSTPGANAAVAADLDGDDNVDIASVASLPGAPATGDQIAWHESDGGSPPQFTEHVISEGSLLPEALALVPAATMDPFEPHQAIVVASSVDDTIYWLTVDSGDPRISTAIVSAEADGVLSVAVADFNEDASFDVVSASAGSNEIAWHENDGGDPPTFTKHVISANAENASGVSVADIDGDGCTDVASASPGDDKVAWYRQACTGGMPGGSFEELIVSQANGDGPVAVHAADVDADTDVDLVVAARDAGDILLFVNETPQTSAASRGVAAGGLPQQPVFQRVVLVGSAPGARSVTVADLADLADLDGAETAGNPPEILYASAGDNTVAWLELVRAATSSPCMAATPAPTVFPDEADGILDFSPPLSDGKVRTLASHAVHVGTSRTLELMVANPFATPLTGFTLEGADATSFAVEAPAEIATGESGSVTLTFSPTATNLSCAELVVATETPEEQARLTLSGEGQSWTERTVTTTAFFARSVAVANVDEPVGSAMARPDILVASSADDTVSVFLQQGTVPAISFTERVVDDRAESARAVIAGDIGGATSGAPGMRVGYVDVITASLFEVNWHEGGIAEECNSFDVPTEMDGEGNPIGDGKINGVELGWIGAGWGSSDPAFAVVDYDRDGRIDGDDLAILASEGVYGESTNVDGDAQELCHSTCVTQE